jgi:hypothetical protein
LVDRRVASGGHLNAVRKTNRRRQLNAPFSPCLQRAAGFPYDAVTRLAPPLVLPFDACFFSELMRTAPPSPPIASLRPTRYATIWNGYNDQGGSQPCRFT